MFLYAEPRLCLELSSHGPRTDCCGAQGGRSLLHQPICDSRAEAQRLRSSARLARVGAAAAAVTSTVRQVSSSTHSGPFYEIARTNSTSDPISAFGSVGPHPTYGWGPGGPHAGGNSDWIV